MQTQELAGKRTKSLLVLTPRMVEILKAVRFYRYITALDMATLLGKEGILIKIRSDMSDLAGQGDNFERQYLYRFKLPSIKEGNKTRIFTLGSRGRDFLQREIGMPVAWYFEPEKVRHISYNQIEHALLLTRFLVAAQKWGKANSFPVEQVRISYELGKGRVIPDGWLLFDSKKPGGRYPVLLEIDRGMEYQQRFKQHVKARIEYIQSGEYEKVFGVKQVTIIYVTTGERPQYRETRCKAMCQWTLEVCQELHFEKWSGLFRFAPVALETLYESTLFDRDVWLEPERKEPVRLFR